MDDYESMRRDRDYWKDKSLHLNPPNTFPEDLWKIPPPFLPIIDFLAQTESSCSSGDAVDATVSALHPLVDQLIDEFTHQREHYVERLEGLDKRCRELDKAREDERATRTTPWPTVAYVDLYAVLRSLLVDQDSMPARIIEYFGKCGWVVVTEEAVELAKFDNVYASGPPQPDGEPFTPMDPVDYPADDGVPWKD